MQKLIAARPTLILILSKSNPFIHTYTYVFYFTFRVLTFYSAQPLVHDQSLLISTCPVKIINLPHGNTYYAMKMNIIKEYLIREV